MGFSIPDMAQTVANAVQAGNDAALERPSKDDPQVVHLMFKWVVRDKEQAREYLRKARHALTEKFGFKWRDLGPRSWGGVAPGADGKGYTTVNVFFVKSGRRWSFWFGAPARRVAKER